MYMHRCTDFMRNAVKQHTMWMRHHVVERSPRKLDVLGSIPYRLLTKTF